MRSAHLDMLATPACEGSDYRKMASSSPSRALIKRNQDASIMPPPPPPKRIKRPARVLDEDVYTDALSHIIARDFFPGLLETESKQEYLDALDSRNQQWIASASRTLREVMTPGRNGRRLRGRRGTSLTTPLATPNGRDGETPRAGGWRGETPGSVVSMSTTTSTQTESQAERPDTNMSLSSFQTKYTSEDNESFYKLLDTQNQKKSERYAWMWAGNKIPAARQIAHRNRERLLADAASSERTENGGKELAVVEPADKRQAMPDTWDAKPNNNFMFAPESVEDEMQTVAQRRQEESRAAPKAVVYDNTRLAPARSSVDDDDNINDDTISITTSAVRDAISGRPRRHASDASSSSVNGTASTPRVNGYAFVDDREPPTPPPTSLPARSGSEGLDPLLLLGGNSDSTPNPFKLHESSKREALHHRMVEKVNKGKRAASSSTSTSTTPRHVGDVSSSAARVAAVQRTPMFMSSPMMGRRAAAADLTPAGHALRGKLSGGRTPTVAAATATATTGLWGISKATTPKVAPSKLRSKVVDS